MPVVFFPKAVEAHSSLENGSLNEENPDLIRENLNLDFNQDIRPHGLCVHSLPRIVETILEYILIERAFIPDLIPNILADVLADKFSSAISLQDSEVNGDLDSSGLSADKKSFAESYNEIQSTLVELFRTKMFGQFSELVLSVGADFDSAETHRIQFNTESFPRECVCDRGGMVEKKELRTAVSAKAFKQKFTHSFPRPPVKKHNRMLFLLIRASGSFEQNQPKLRFEKSPNYTLPTEIPIPYQFYTITHRRKQGFADIRINCGSNSEQDSENGAPNPLRTSNTPESVWFVHKTQLYEFQ